MINLSTIFITLVFSIGHCNADYLFNFSNNILNNRIKIYEQYIKKYKVILKYKQYNGQAQELLGIIIKHTKELFSIPSNKILQQMTESINNCCNYLENYLKQKNSKLNISEKKQLQVMCKFLKTGIRLLNDFASSTDDRYFCILISECPDMIPSLAREFNTIVNIGSMLNHSNTNISGVINILNQLVQYSDENTYLLSTVFTLAMNRNMSLNQIIICKDISNKQICQYLDWCV